MEKYSPTPAGASIRVLLMTAAAKDGKLRYFDVEQAFLMVGYIQGVFREQ